MRDYHQRDTLAQADELEVERYGQLSGESKTMHATAMHTTLGESTLYPVGCSVPRVSNPNQRTKH